MDKVKRISGGGSANKGKELRDYGLGHHDSQRALEVALGAEFS